MRRHGEEKVGTWLEVALDHMVRSWWVCVIMFIWTEVIWQGGVWWWTEYNQLLFQGRLPQSTILVSSVDFYLSATLKTSE